MKIKKIENKNKHLIKKVLEENKLNRMPMTSHIYGLFDKEKVIGVIIYGNSCGKSSEKIIQLQRINILNKYKNIKLDWFLTETLKLLKAENSFDFVIAYNDIDNIDFNGVYKKSNWIYVGTTKKMKDYKIKGIEKLHSRGILNGLTVKELKKLFGDEFYRLDRLRKFKFVFSFSNNDKKIVGKYPEKTDLNIKKLIKNNLKTKKILNNYNKKIFNNYKKIILNYKLNKEKND